MSKGYSLIEVLVAISIFSAIIAAPSGLFVGSLNGQQRVLASQELLDNVSYVVEKMSKALRMAKKDDLDGINCLSGEKVNYEAINGLAIRTYNDSCQTFKVEYDPENKVNRLVEIKDGREEWLTSSNIDIIEMKIGPSDSWDQQDDFDQPRVTILLKAKYAKGRMLPEISIQTTISQRDLDVKY